jgi:diacylglycerol kinase (ATP)
MKSGGPEAHHGEIEQAAREAELVVIAGGDGSVHHTAPIAMRTGAPIYHLPCGNENLLAREFGMTRVPRDLSKAIESGKRIATDVGTIGVNGGAPRHFLLMVSFGPDASVVHRLAASRTRATGHLAYAGPITAEFLRPHLPRVSVWVDGGQVVDDRRGLLVIANSRQYAFRVDPCHRASMTDGKLDVLFMPCEGRWGALRWGVRCRRRRAEACGAVAATGSEVRVRTDGASQVDGESHATATAGAELAFGVKPGALRCLAPPSPL